MRLEPNLVYRFDITGKVALGPISKQTLYKKLTDGRIAGFLMEDFIEAAFSNTSLAPNNQSPFDLFITDQNESKKYESKVITLSTGLCLLPSNQRGQNRITNDEAYRVRRANLDGYVITDITESPILRVLALSEESVPMYKTMGFKSACRLFEGRKIIKV